MPGKPTPPRKTRKPAAPTSWDPLAAWYDGWVGEGGSEHHRQVAVPATLKMLDMRPGEEILDVGCGQGVLAPSVLRAGAHYTGVDASPRLIQYAKRHHGSQGRFFVGDARNLASLQPLRQHTFDAIVFLLSLQDMDPLEPVLASIPSVLNDGGRVVLLLTHPGFRVPRQSGWGWDEGRKLMFRRIDRYLTPLPVPMKSLPGHGGRTTTSFHRPIQSYVNGLAEHGLLVDRLEEIPMTKLKIAGQPTKSERLARQEIPLFLGIRARKISRVPSSLIISETRDNSAADWTV